MDYSRRSEVLMSLKDWDIRMDVMYEGSLQFFASHTCIKLDSEFNVLAWFCTDEKSMCYHCGQEVPDQVQTIVQLLAR